MKDLEIIEQIINELLKHEGKQKEDIIKIAEGGYSSVYKIGSKIIKIGEEPQTYKLPKDSKRFLRPLIRRKIETKGKMINIEITEAVDTEGITDEDVYKIYKELREEGIIWTDAKKENLGKLRYDNVPHFR